MSNKDCDLLNYSTTYKHDFYKKSPYPKSKINKESEFKNPITEGFRKYLNLQHSDKSIGEPFQNGNAYIENTKDRYECLSKIFNGKYIDETLIQKQLNYENKSVYQVNYCDLNKDKEMKELEKRNRIVLPLDVYIPSTTQKSSYRIPIELNSRVYERKPLTRPEQLLKPDPKINEILKVKTGDSEYMERIGNLGQFIIEHQMHGKIVR